MLRFTYHRIITFGWWVPCFVLLYVNQVLLLRYILHPVLQNHALQSELTDQEAIISDMAMELKIVKGAKTAAENTCKALQQKVNDVDSMLRSSLLNFSFTGLSWLNFSCVIIIRWVIAWHLLLTRNWDSSWKNKRCMLGHQGIRSFGTRVQSSVTSPTYNLSGIL